MTLIHSRQAQSFLVTGDALYKRRPPHQIIPYMVRMSSPVRSTPMNHRTGAVKMVQSNMLDAWAKIHRAMRPYFFMPIDDVLANYPSSPVELPNLDDMPHIHSSLHFCLDVLVDLDRLTMIVQSDEAAVDGDETIFSCWNAVYRATGRSEGIERRIKSGKGFKNEDV